MAADGVTVFVTTHYMDEAEYCGRLVSIYRGQIVASGSPSALKSGEDEGELLLVECEPVGRALEVLQTGPGRFGCRYFRQRDPCRGDQGDRGCSSSSAEYLSEHQPLPSRRSTLSAPRLEDVFVSLTSRRAEPAGRGRTRDETPPAGRHSHGKNAPDRARRQERGYRCRHAGRR